MKRSTTVAVVALLAGPALLAPSAAAAAVPAAATSCADVTDGSTVEGDLVVRAGSTCELADVVVTGQTRLGEAAELSLTGATLGGRVAVGPDAALDLDGSTVEGRLVHRGYSVTATGSTFAGAVVVAADVARPALLVVEGGEVAGEVRAVGAEVVLEGTRVGGDVVTESGSATDVVDTVVRGDLQVLGSTAGALVCESEVHGDALFGDNDLGVQLGRTGPLAECDGQGVWGGDVVVEGTDGEVRLDGNIVRGDLSGVDNAPAPTGADNRVRGDLRGQMADL